MIENVAYKSILVSLAFLVLLITLFVLGLAIGSTGHGCCNVIRNLISPEEDSIVATIIWEIRFPRVLLAALAGAVLSLGGLVFQALLRNPLSEPYILGISGGSAVGAILGMVLGLATFPGVAMFSFLGSMSTLGLVLFISSGKRFLQENSLLLAGVMVNAFCSAIIMFLISIAHSSRLQNVLFWLMGNLSDALLDQVLVLLVIALPFFLVCFIFSKLMNVLLLGSETAQTLGVNVKIVSLILLVTTSFGISAVVCLSGLIGFVGLVIPHLLRLLLGPDHRVLTPACILGGASFLIGCDLLSRVLPAQGEMPVGVVTAMIGAPAFIFLLYRQKT
jgi:iron complex transport system permease protein